MDFSAFFMVQLSHSYMTTRKTIALTIQTFVSKVMSLLFNMLSRFVIAFLPRSKSLLISWLQSPERSIDNFYSYSAEKQMRAKICHCVQDHRPVFYTAGIQIWVSDNKASALNPSLLQFLFVMNDNTVSPLNSKEFCSEWVS